MSVAVTVRVESAAATASLRAITSAMNDKAGLHGAAAAAVARLARTHIREDYLPRDKDGVDFWADVLNSIEAAANDHEATVSMREIGLRLRYYGGEVTPGKSISSYTGKPTRALAVPTDKVGVGAGRRLPPVKSGIMAFIRRAQGGETVGYLVEGMEKTLARGPRKGETRIMPKPGGSLLYTLRTITRHRPDKGILPPDERLVAAASLAAREFVASFED